MLARVAKEFGVLPSTLARDLDRDPEQLSLVCFKLLRYADMKDAYDAATPEGRKALDPLRRSAPKLFALVEENTAAAAEAELSER